MSIIDDKYNNDIEMGLISYNPENNFFNSNSNIIIDSKEEYKLLESDSESFTSISNDSDFNSNSDSDSDSDSVLFTTIDSKIL
tara:strand:- start:333 stop:581 length:249 start_codon:yes stop_codon:yes gene_type:complete